jgi:preprotein translocase subunit SecG
LIALFFVLKVDWPQTPFMQGLRDLDWIGCALIVGGTICFLFGLESGSGGALGWGSPTVICLLVFGVAIMAAFFAYEALWAKNPLFPMRIFTSASIVAAFVTTCLHSFVFISWDYFLPLYFQVILGFSPIISGVSLFALVVPLSITTFLAGMLVRKTGNYVVPIWAGATIMTLGSGLYIALEPQTNWAKVIVFQIIAGVGAGPLFQAPMIAMQSQVDRQDVASASSAMTFMRTLFTSTSIVIGSVLLQRSLGGASLTGAAAHGGGGTEIVAGPVDNGQYMTALRTMWAFYTAISGVMLIVTLFIRPVDLRKSSNKPQAADSESEKGQAQQVIVEKGAN